MLRKFRVSVDGQAYDVVVEELHDEGHTGLPHAAPAHAGSAHVAHAAAVVAAAPAAAAKPVVRPVVRQAADAGAELAPLAGVVVEVDVAPGVEVGPGVRIAVIEAMKMKTDVFAKGVGSVVSVAVKPGDAVDAGDVLVTLG
jgi:biotin carboxyl carrier protein